MFYAEIRFKSAGPSSASQEDDLAELQGTLTKNGQLVGASVMGWDDGWYRLCGTAPVEDALSAEYSSEYVARAWDRLPQERAVRVGSGRASFRRSLQGAQRLYVVGEKRSRLLDEDGLEIPLYLLPFEYDVRERLFFWLQNFDRIHGIEAATSALEFEAYREMADPWSGLSRAGRRWAALLEKQSGVPSYYFLPRFYGYEDEPLVCPVCGRKWTQLEEDIFELECSECRLVSDLPDDRSDDYRAYLGSAPGDPSA